MVMRRLILFFFLLPLLVTYSQNCPLQIWVYDALEKCENVNPPNAVGTLYADGTCRTMETTTAAAAAIVGTTDYGLLPGTYKATCTKEGKIRFSDSGCLTETCAVPAGGSGSNSDGIICQRDFQFAGALFSRFDPPEYIVQDEENANANGFFTCSKLAGSDDNPVTVTFAIFGNCSSTCVEPPVVVMPAAATAPSISAVVPSPAAAPLAVPTAPFFIIPSAPPFTHNDTPVSRPVFAPPRNEPVPVPVSAPVPIFPGVPVPAPVPAPTSIPQGHLPVPITVPVPVPTNLRTLPPVPVPVLYTTPRTLPPTGTKMPTTAPSQDSVVELTISETISVALDLSPMTTAMSPSATKVFVTAVTQQIAESSPSVHTVRLVNLHQSLEAADNDSLRVSFRLVFQYADDEDAKGIVFFVTAFGTERARTSLVVQLLQNNTDFALLRLIEVVGGPPSQDESVDTKGGASQALLAGGVGAVATILILSAGLAVGCAMRRKKSYIRFVDRPVVEESLITSSVPLADVMNASVQIAEVVVVRDESSSSVHIADVVLVDESSSGPPATTTTTSPGPVPFPSFKDQVRDQSQN
jgi:hypothetical protein